MMTRMVATMAGDEWLRDPGSADYWWEVFLIGLESGKNLIMKAAMEGMAEVCEAND